MLFDKFKSDCEKYWNEYFKIIEKNSINISSPGTPLFPSHISFMDFGNYYGVELLGAELKPKPLKKKITKYKDVTDYFNLFKDPVNKPVLKFEGGNGLTHLCFIQGGDLEVAQKRFPFIDLYTSRIGAKGAQGAMFEFSQNLEDIFFERCAIINQSEGLFRCKNILFLAIFIKSVTSVELITFYSKLLESSDGNGSTVIHGIFTAGKDKERILMASQLQNLYLSSGVHETTIGDFLAGSPEILKSVFKTDRFVHEPSLKWIEHDGSVQESSINPDLFIKRADGKYDIIDLKLALLNKKRVTIGSRARRKFISSVIDGIAQLANYKFYFSFEKNREYALEKYDIDIDEPTLTLVVGSMENVYVDEVIEALRAHAEMNIIDYDTIVSTYLNIDK